ncbi:MAG: EAL domain-containing protein, partial [Eubacteriales bacterium]
IIIRSDKKKLLDETDVDPVLGCNTYNKFVYDAKTLLDQNRFSRYALIYFDIYKFHYLNDHLTPEQTSGVLKQIANICKQMIDANESSGHVIDDSFVLIMHYIDMTELGERIKLLGALVSNYSASKKLGMDIRLSVGIYLVQGDQRQDVSKMLDCAKIALQANKKFVEEPYTVYDAAIASAYLEEAELEAKMRTALKNRDFKLFFQPKYSIANDSVESAEVLVRWYNPELQTYTAPDSFIRVFEANGFICELDHYVFEETCRFLNDFTSHGEKIVPLSVNVSRATAIKPDFLRFYIEKKKEYGIADGFITLEFTESFAAESYELLEDLLTMLKSNGFKCAVDDFGMGNSSLIAVKALPIDELKFDRALLKSGKDAQKDDAIMKMLIDVSKELGMTVTQEGVETREDMERMRALGCDIIQGYYYAKPMHTVDFVDFINDDTSLAGIRRFKKT